MPGILGASWTAAARSSQVASWLSLAARSAGAGAGPAGRHRPEAPRRPEPGALRPDAAGSRGPDADTRQGDQAGRGHRPGLRRRPHPDHRGQGLRRPRHRRGHRSAAHRRGQRQRQPRGRGAPGDLQARERADDRRVERHGGDHLPAVGVEPQAPADAHARPQARHPHRRAQLRLRRLDAREDRDLHRQRQDPPHASTCGRPTGSCGRSRGATPSAPAGTSRARVAALDAPAPRPRQPAARVARPRRWRSAVCAFGVGRLSPWWLALPAVGLRRARRRPRPGARRGSNEPGRAAAYVERRACAPGASLAGPRHHGPGLAAARSSLRRGPRPLRRGQPLRAAVDRPHDGRRGDPGRLAAGAGDRPTRSPNARQAARDLAGRDAFREDLAVLGPEVPHRAPTRRRSCAWARRRHGAAGLGTGRCWRVLGGQRSSAASACGWPAASRRRGCCRRVAVQAAIGLWLRPPRAARRFASSSRARAIWRWWRPLLERVEHEPFAAPRARRAARPALPATGLPASHEVRRLTRLVDLLTSRQNQFFAPVAFLVFWATQLAWAVDRWRLSRRRRRCPAGSTRSARSRRWRRWAATPPNIPSHVFPEFDDGCAAADRHATRAPAAAGRRRRRQRPRARWRRRRSCCW